MPFYRVYRPGEQEAFPYSADDDHAHRITVLLSTLEQTSLWKIALELLIASLFRMPRYKVPVEFGMEVINKSLGEEFQFAQENKFSFKCDLNREKSELMFFPSYRPQHVEDSAGWLQRRILILRYRMKFRIFLPKP
jgi:hypothetical protein